MKRSFLKTPDEVREWFKSVQGDVLSVDFETTSLNYLEMELVGISFCDGKQSCYIDLWENNDARNILNYIQSVLRRYLLVAHNAKFEFKCFQKFIGCGFDNLFCTFIASFLLDENRQSHSLDALALEYFGIGKAGKWEDYLDWHSEEFYEYAIRDSELCFMLYTRFLPLIQEEDLEHVFQIEMDFIPVAAEIEMNGILIDQQALAELQSTVEKKILESEDNLLRLVGKKADLQEGLFGQKFRNSPINFNSPMQLYQCFCKLGLEVKERTDTGAPSIGKTTLKRLEGHPFVDELSEYKKLKKLYTGYIIPAWEMIDADGRIRPNIGIVKTGRTSMSSPNLQQLPNVRDKTINYRGIFTSRDILIGADYSGQELRILGEITQDENILHAFSIDADLHLLTASHIFDLGLKASDCVSSLSNYEALKTKYKSERYKAKNGANFPIVYGSSPGGIAWRQGVTKDEAQRWVDGFFKAYPRVKKAMDNIPGELLAGGMVSTLMGRRRRFPNYRSLSQYARGKLPSKDRCVRQAFNFMIQGFAADQAKIAGRKIYDQLKKHPEWEARIILIVHDEFVCECKKEHENEVKNCIKNCMENAVSLSVPFVVEVKSGRNYSEIK